MPDPQGGISAPRNVNPAEKPASPLVYQPFPLSSLAEPVRGYVAEAASALGVDPAFVALPALTACASAIGNTRVIQLKRGWTEPAILWAAIIAYSGTLKSPSLDAGIKPMYRVQQRLLQEHAQEMARYLEEKLSAKGTDRAPPEKPVPQRVLVSDTNIEKLGSILSQNPRGVLVNRDELSAWFGSITVRELMRSNNRRFTDAALAENALNQLVQDHLGEWSDSKPAKGGHPRRAFRLFQQPGSDAAALHDTCMTLAPEPANSPGKNGECHASCVTHHAEVKPSSSVNISKEPAPGWTAEDADPAAMLNPFATGPA
jgi:hypothetical protein